MVDIDFQDKNILILGAPRSGTHALGSLLHQQDPQLTYLKEIGMVQHSDTPWKDFDLFCNTTPRKLAHIVQLYSKIFAVGNISEIKKHTIIISLRRRDKVKQFASWMFFKHIGEIYKFQHAGQHYIPPGSITATLNDIESFIINQTIDNAFNPDHTVYYEDLILDKSQVKKNQYMYPIEQIFSNFNLVNEHLGNWKYND
jgi:hypothetical protein